MGFFETIGLGNRPTVIDWDLKPAETFGIFESWGGRIRVRNKNDRYYYFYIDGWQQPANVCLMERGIKHARRVARIKAPQELVDQAMAGQGKAITLDRSYAINDALRRWLNKHLLEQFDPSLVTPLAEEAAHELTETGLPRANQFTELPNRLTLPPCASHLTDAEVSALLQDGNYFDSRQNPAGLFVNALVDNEDGATVTDLRTGIMWQRAGNGEINTLRHMQAYVDQMNGRQLAGFDDWRLPTIAEGLTLLHRDKNGHGLHQHSCFSPEQPFIFTAQARKPGGHWFIDFNSGAIFWASAFNPGGYCRLCRTITF